MNILIVEDFESLSKLAAGMIQDQIKSNPNSVLGLATGQTPTGVYQELIRLHKEEGLDFSSVTTFNLDEYIGLDSEHPNSYSYYMRKVLFEHININIENTFIPNGIAADIEESCKAYDQLIKDKDGIDIQILGIGENGHIAFNEPSDKLNLKTSIVKLADTTIKSNSKFFNSIDQIPRSAISMGLGNIMEAKKIILLANGKNKSQIIKKLIKAEHISTQIPASILLLHPDFTLIISKEAYEG